MAWSHCGCVAYPTRAQVRLLEPDVADVYKYPDAAMDLRITEAIDRVERICGRRFTTTTVTEVRPIRAGRVVLSEATSAHRGGASPSISSVTLRAPFITDQTIAPSEVSVVSGRLVRSSGWVSSWSSGWSSSLYSSQAPNQSSGWPNEGEVVVSYVTGLATTPPEIFALVARLARYLTLRPTSSVPDRAERFSNASDGRTFTLAMPSALALGMPDLDAVLSRWTLQTMTA